MKFVNTSDQSLLALYDSVRRQVSADLQSSRRYRFIGERAKQYAETLREELLRRRLPFTPIEWP